MRLILLIPDHCQCFYFEKFRTESYKTSGQCLDKSLM